MTRLALLTLPSLILAATLAAQADDTRTNTVEMKIQRALTADNNGVPDTLDSISADRLVLNYELLNVGETDIRLEHLEIAEAVNCKVQVTTMPGRIIAAGESTRMVIEATPAAEGPLSFTVNMNVNGAHYSMPVQTTVNAVLHWSVSAHAHHDDDDHHCTTGEGGSWVLLGAAAAVMAVLVVRRRM